MNNPLANYLVQPHVFLPDALHFVLGVRHHFPLAQHPVHLVLLAEEAEGLQGAFVMISLIIRLNVDK